MSLYITSLNSGSNGNCYYIANEKEAVLVDVGISCREVEKRMLRLGLLIDKVKAIFISHEHSDHIKGLEVLSRKHHIPVFITEPTLRHGKLMIKAGLANAFRAYEKIQIGELLITAFPKWHDASDPHSFVITGNEVTVGVFTDIGYACEHVIENFKKCHAAFLEANYDERMLEEGNYPFYLKRRIQSDKGHLSNTQALELFTKHKSPFLRQILLAHLSKENNSPQLVQQLFTQHSGETKVVVASRDYETNVYRIQADTAEHVHEPIETGIKGNMQISLF
jgi:phosphoribosyl 1,2-cyclic phosphodiesterase